jgi:hypothetical protein
MLRGENYETGVQELEQLLQWVAQIAKIDQMSVLCTDYKPSEDVVSAILAVATGLRAPKLMNLSQWDP